MRNQFVFLAIMISGTSAFAGSTIEQFKCLQGTQNKAAIAEQVGSVGDVVEIEEISKLIYDEKGEIKPGYGLVESSTEVRIVLPSDGKAGSLCENKDKATYLVVRIQK